MSFDLRVNLAYNIFSYIEDAQNHVSKVKNLDQIDRNICLACLTLLLEQPKWPDIRDCLMNNDETNYLNHFRNSPAVKPSSTLGSLMKGIQNKLGLRISSQKILDELKVVSLAKKNPKITIALRKEGQEEDVRIHDLEQRLARLNQPLSLPSKPLAKKAATVKQPPKNKKNTEKTALLA